MIPRKWVAYESGFHIKMLLSDFYMLGFFSCYLIFLCRASSSACHSSNSAGGPRNSDSMNSDNTNSACRLVPLLIIVVNSRKTHGIFGTKKHSANLPTQIFLVPSGCFLSSTEIPTPQNDKLAAISR
jgi:hypothetical protein